MVITYNPKELNMIGEYVIIRDLISQMQVDTIQQQFEMFQNKVQLDYNFKIKSNDQMKEQDDKESTDFEADSGGEKLTKSVADFFKKAQQNFYSQSNIDPTKVRRLSEVEAELFNQSQSY